MPDDGRGDPIVACFSRDCGDGLLMPAFVSGDFVSSLLEKEICAVVALDCGFEIVAANTAARQLLGMADTALPASAAEYVGAQALERVEGIFSSPGSMHCAAFRAMVGRNGAARQLHVRANRLCDEARRTIGVTLAFSRALWDDFEMPRAFVPERVETLGLYAAGIVHEFSNLLSVISGRAGLGLMAEGPSAKDRALDNVITAARRAEHITKNLLTYVRRKTPDFVLVDLRRPVLDAIALLEVEFTSSCIEISRRFEDLPMVLCDPVQISQVCFNLMRNARDAMPEGGMVTVSLRRSGDWAILEVSDTGTGISPEVRARLFEPFVSGGRGSRLKPSGTGLGLFVTREIVLAHGGEISVESELARGSKFSVRLPLVREA